MTAAENSSFYRFLVQPRLLGDPRSNALLLDVHALGVLSVTTIRCLDLYFLSGEFTEEEISQICMLLHDSVAQRIDWSQGHACDHKAGRADEAQIIEVALRPGVTDAVAEQILRAAALMGIRGLRSAASGQRFLIEGAGLTDSDLHNLASRLLSNPVIQRYAIGAIEDVFPTPASKSGGVEMLPVRGLSHEKLIALSQDRRAALDLKEMLAIQSYCEQEARDLTDVEFEMVAQTWSEHCVHKTFKAHIDVQKNGQHTEIGNLFRETIQSATRKINAPWVRYAFVDNAGVIEFDEEYDLAFKVETHNHPSAIEPFGGANTGVGGVIRDVIGVSAKPIACTDVLCFGPQDTRFSALPDGVLHPRRIFSGVVAGVADYGNKIGIPTISGAIWYDPAYIANPLVYCGCVGLLPTGSHPRQPQCGDHIIVVGGRTGRDGLRGATFSSMAMDAQTGEVSGASVQIGAPVVEKGLIDVVILARNERLYHAITDCGAGGLSSAVGEMSREIGAQVQLERVPLKYCGLLPWEIWLSEAQERMVLAVSDNNLSRLSELCKRYDVEMTDIGNFTGSSRLIVRYAEDTVVDLQNHFLHDGLPQRRLTANSLDPQYLPGSLGALKPVSTRYSTLLLRLLAHPNIASKSAVIRVYDHEVQGGIVVKPLTGRMNEGPSDAVVIKPLCTHSDRAMALSAGFNPEMGKLDPYQMALNVIDEAVRNALAVGADPSRIAILDNFCWGNPRRAETLGELVEAARGCHDGAIYFGSPFISGKDSLNNEYLGADGNRYAIPPSLLISAIGLLQHWNLAVTMDLKRPGSLFYLVGEMQPAFGGSHFNLVCDEHERQLQDGVPALHPLTKDNYSLLHQAMQTGLVLACHDLSEGGLAVAAAEMCIGGRLGLELDIDPADLLRWLFGETTGCLLVEVDEKDRSVFEEVLAQASKVMLGGVTTEQKLTVRVNGKKVLELEIADMAQAWNAPGHTIE